MHKRPVAILWVLYENYEFNDGGCYRIHRLEENLYENYLPSDYNRDSVNTYHWHQNRNDNMQGQFNIYYTVTKESVSRASMFLYITLLLLIGLFGDMLANFLWDLITGAL